jgi:DNA repair photolyase
VKYVLVDNSMDSINTTVELASEVGISGARTYFKGVKRIDGKSFDKLWRVMTEANYWSYVKNKQSHQGIRWWEEDKEITDSELKI